MRTRPSFLGAFPDDTPSLDVIRDSEPHLVSTTFGPGGVEKPAATLRCRKLVRGRGLVRSRGLDG